MCLQVVQGDGEISGCIAMIHILEAYRAAGRSDPPLIINLTGNVLKEDMANFKAVSL